VASEHRSGPLSDIRVESRSEPLSEARAGLTLARILRARGRKGEVAAEILTDFPERLTQLREVWLTDGRGASRRAGVRRCWLSTSRGGQAIFHFEGFDSIAQAETLVGLEVQVPIEDRMPLPQGRYYITDLIGCEIWEKEQRIGSVRDVQATGEASRGTPVLVAECADGELLIPLAEEICVRIDTGARRIEVVLPEGLREMNA
jgi:16S rRNA processing protein RimM